ncbi:MAG: protein-glutamate O-methyltransferase CheR, partial [Acidobacteria bacterium]|nr:protein-glutamate O-methyltransferase CheR [Acidobacteriota bacterium]
ENLAIHETSFFRNKPQVDLFHKAVLDELIQRKESENDFNLQVWSAGCSTGQEPYTLAMLAVDALAFHCLRRPQPPAPPGERPLVPQPWRFEVLASDLSYAALRAAQEASYPESQLEQVEYTYRLRFFDRCGDRYVIKKSLRQLVHFDFHNLKTEFLPRKNDVIFCRNVMIYFDEAEQKRLVQKFYRCLNPHGYLFIGHAESLLGISDKFRMIHHKNGTAYQRLEETTA